MSDKLILTIAVALSLGTGFLFGKIQPLEQESFCLTSDFPPEISIIQMKKIIGDALTVDISGPARIVWGDSKLVENDGKYEIPLGQIPQESDLKFTQFPYVGNEKTMKLYPADSYYARGTAVEHRRFFSTMQEALDQGFVPIKSLQ